MADLIMGITNIADDTIAYQRAVDGLRMAIANGLMTIGDTWQYAAVRAAADYNAILEHEMHSYDRARELLLSCLNDEQRADYEMYGSFNVTKGRGVFERVYNISEDSPHVTRIDRRWVLQYCVLIPLADIPIPDLMLAIKMMVESDERRFLRTANVRYKYPSAVRERQSWKNFNP